MPIIQTRERWTRQPEYPALINYAGLGKGIRMLFNPAIGPIDQVTGRVWAPGGDTAIVASDKGKALSFDGASDSLTYTGYPGMTSNIGTFFMYCPTVGAASAFGHIPFSTSSPGIIYYQVTDALGIYIMATLGSGSLSSWFNTTNRSLVLVSGGTAATCKAYIDGVDSGITWSVDPTGWGAGDKAWQLGGYAGGASWDFNGTILNNGFTDEVWGDGQAKEYHDSKGYALYEGEETFSYYASAGSSSFLAAWARRSNVMLDAGVMR